MVKTRNRSTLRLAYLQLTNCEYIIIVQNDDKMFTLNYRTKEIHFSLPPLRSNSLGDLDCPQDHPYDSDVDSDALLVPGQSQSHRSNSFSKFVFVLVQVNIIVSINVVKYVV